MGYANSLPYQQLLISTGLRAVRTITGAPSNQDIADFVVPSFKSPITHAYLDVIIHSIRDTAGTGGNSLANSGSFGLWDSPKANYYSSNSMSSDWLSVGDSAWGYGNFVLPGVTNLATIIEPGATQTCSFAGIQANAANLMLYGVMAQLRLYFAV